MENKKKLLITSGDSYTEGAGCFDFSKIPHHIKHIDDLPEEEAIHQSYYSHEFGWPNRLGKKLNYDKVINLGLGGSGQSAHVKLFFEKIIGNDFSDYEVLVIWMLSEPARFSFYSNGILSQFLPNTYGNDSHELEIAYIKNIKNIFYDSILETIFYIKCMEQVCENNKFNLLITSWERQSFAEIKNKYKSKFYFNETDGFIANVPTEGEYKSRICSHPNEKGYELISENMFNSIKKYHSDLLNQNEVEKFEWVWDGQPDRWNLDKFI